MQRYKCTFIYIYVILRRNMFDIDSILMILLDFLEQVTNRSIIMDPILAIQMKKSPIMRMICS